MRKVRLRIKEVAEEKHISQHRLHLRSEIALSSIRRFYQYPDAEIQLSTLARIADVLNVSVCELFEEYEE